MSRAPAAQRLRADAAKALFQILEQGQSARDVLPAIQQYHQGKDKAWLQEMVYGVLRQLPLLQYWLRQMLDKPLKGNQKILEHLVILGFYQLVFTRVSTHAAVSETVNACKALKGDKLRGLVNAVLRNFIRLEKEQDLPEDPQLKSGLPKWLYRKLQQAYPSQMDELVTAMQQRPPTWLRVNSVRTTVEEYAAALKQVALDFESTTHSDGLILAKSQDITALPGFAEGWFAVQDGAAQLAADYLPIEPGERVLDCCAAPGGKTCHLLERQPQLRECVALDIDEKRLARVAENLERLGHTATLVSGDAADPTTWWDTQLFDKILLDAPCSATGIIRRHPDIKWLRKGADIDVLAQLQSNILDAIWGLLRPGGTLLYATCSILPQENSEQIKAFLARTPDATLDSLEDNATSEIGRQILPGEGQMDGFYYARLLKSKQTQ